jgi:hypothetical protein
VVYYRKDRLEEDSMATAQTTGNRPSESAIFGRLLSNGKAELSSELARYLLGLDFNAEDKVRMHELAMRNQDGALSAEEKEELLAYVKAGHLMAVLQSRARRVLKRKP